MNFGDRLKQLRTQKNLTQPQLAQAVGIEQSYLSKLENDKSIPGAEIFQAILRALNMDVAEFLEGVDDNVVHRELRQVPEVANHLNSRVALRIHSVRQWLFTSAALAVVGLTLFFAGHQQLLFSGTHYTYESLGIVHPDEPSEVFEIWDQWLQAKLNANEFSREELSKRRAGMIARTQETYLFTSENRGEAFIEKVAGGSRLYKLKMPSFSPRVENRYLMFAGLLLSFAGLFGFIVEMRLRNLKRS
jgi:transcriptional regulator with XRE-family HTH domain